MDFILKLNLIAILLLIIWITPNQNFAAESNESPKDIRTDLLSVRYIMGKKYKDQKLYKLALKEFDAVLTEIRKSKKDIAVNKLGFDTCIAMSDIYLELKEIGSFAAYGTKADSFIDTNFSNEIKANCYGSVANINYVIGNGFKALKYYKLAVLKNPDSKNNSEYIDRINMLHRYCGSESLESMASKKLKPIMFNKADYKSLSALDQVNIQILLNKVDSFPLKALSKEEIANRLLSAYIDYSSVFKSLSKFTTYKSSELKLSFDQLYSIAQSNHDYEDGLKVSRMRKLTKTHYESLQELRFFCSVEAIRKITNNLGYSFQLPIRYKPHKQYDRIQDSTKFIQEQIDTNYGDFYTK